MKNKVFALAVLLIATVQFGYAQLKTADIVKEWERSKVYTKEYLDAMPEGSYGLKPTPQMRSFAEQMLHLADANNNLAALAFGIKSPSAIGEFEKSADKSKEKVASIVMASYDYVIDHAKKMTVEQLNENVKLFNQFEMNRHTALAKVLEHQAHHRGQTTVYLRLAGITPPQEKLF